MKFNMSAAWREATSMMGANREVLLIVAGIFFFLPSLLSGIVSPNLQDVVGGLEDPEAMQAQIIAAYGGYAWLYVLVFFAQIVGYLALLALLRDDSKPTVGDALRTGAIGLLPGIGALLLFVIGFSLIGGLLVGASAASGLPVLAVIASMLLFVGMIYSMVKISLSPAVIAIEKVFNPFRILARSWKLTKGNSVRLFLFYFLIYLVYFVIAIVLSVLLSALVFVLGDTAFTFVGAVAQGLIGAGLSIVFVAVIAAAHRQLAGPSASAVSQTFE
ncbi:MFS family permease [Altererythrobacter atlanticus]|uniref:Uncharacterized protein n=1 Tax=Croceibacterium atlanticum TaxID=1267766 RepID=A0A0F7KTU4_9SPHN|nr:hypothetical protein [Croceibacterium atlanticum]AKH42576.1 hypothetical protein WYH_01537 [Croceibacterium atlanticum]MBB5731353.1 MFS family permease [Croceibacterium atlanticum]